jgi:hypothetical protein
MRQAKSLSLFLFCDIIIVYKGENYMNDKDLLLGYSRAVANLVDYMFHDCGVSWEVIAGLLSSAGLDEEEIAMYDLTDLVDIE